MMQILSLLLVWALVTPITYGINDVSLIYSSPAVNGEREWKLSFSSEQDTLCSLRFNSSVGTESLIAMDMSAPVSSHNLFFLLEDSDTEAWTLSLTVFYSNGTAIRLNSIYVDLSTVADAEGDMEYALPPTTATEASVSVTEGVMDVSDVTHNSANVDVTIGETISVFYYKAVADSEYLMQRATGAAQDASGNILAFSNPAVTLLALEAETVYTTYALLIDISGSIISTEIDTFTTDVAPDDDTAANMGDNTALLSLGASVIDLSSNFGGGTNLDSSFGGNKAIDGSDSSEWSSNGDGNSAFIVIALPDEVDLWGVGVWTRTMTSSAKIQSFSISLATAASPDTFSVVDTWDLPDANALYTFEFPFAQTAQYVRLDVVTSTGGNTGLKSLEVYSIADENSDNDSSTSSAYDSTNTMVPSSASSTFSTSSASSLFSKTSASFTSLLSSTSSSGSTLSSSSSSSAVRSSSSSSSSSASSSSDTSSLLVSSSSSSALTSSEESSSSLISSSVVLPGLTSLMLTSEFASASGKKSIAICLLASILLFAFFV